MDVGDGLTPDSPGSLVGTLTFMAPEQATRGRAITERSDLFAVAVLLYYAFSGKLPFRGQRRPRRARLRRPRARPCPSAASAATRPAALEEHSSAAPSPSTPTPASPAPTRCAPPSADRRRGAVAWGTPEPADAGAPPCARWARPTPGPRRSSAASRARRRRERLCAAAAVVPACLAHRARLPSSVQGLLTRSRLPGTRGTAGGDPMDALDLLEQQHRDLARALRRRDRGRGAGRRTAAVAQLVRAVEAHSRVEETRLLRRLRRPRVGAAEAASTRPSRTTRCSASRP